MDFEEVDHELGLDALEVDRVGVHKLKLPHIHDVTLLLVLDRLLDHLGHPITVASWVSAFVEKTLHFKRLLESMMHDLLVLEMQDHFSESRLVPVIDEADEDVVRRHNEEDDFDDDLIEELHLFVAQSVVVN